MIYAFENCILDVQRHELQRAGIPVQLKTRVFEVLAYLVSNSHRVVLRDELIQHVWPDQGVGSATLTSYIKAARLATGDTGRTQRIIQTIHCRGYRCVATVTALTDTQAKAASVATSDPHADLPQRRQLTMMYCDLVDSTGLARRLDLEDFLEVISAYHTTCTEVIQRFDGYIAQYLGDGLLAYFGYPLDREDATLQAVQAGLQILDAIETLNLHLQATYGVRLAIRLGVDTGQVVIRHLGSHEDSKPLAFGETSMRVAQLQELASPNSILISADIYQGVHESALCYDMGLHVLTELSSPVRVYQVLREEPSSVHRLQNPLMLPLKRQPKPSDERLVFLR